MRKPKLKILSAECNSLRSGLPANSSMRGGPITSATRAASINSEPNQRNILRQSNAILPVPPVGRGPYTCPMDPEVVQDSPGACPICGMALEPKSVSLEEEENPEFALMKRRFWISLLLTAPILMAAMGEMLSGSIFKGSVWLQLILATPVVLWGGWPFFQRAWASVINRSLNMFTLIAVGTGTAYAYSVFAALFPSLLPSRSAATTGLRRCILKLRR